MGQDGVDDQLLDLCQKLQAGVDLAPNSSGFEPCQSSSPSPVRKMLGEKLGQIGTEKAPYQVIQGEHHRINFSARPHVRITSALLMLWDLVDV